MFKQFHSIWKHGTVKQYQIVSRRNISSSRCLQVHAKHTDSLNQSKANLPQRTLLSTLSSGEKRYAIRCISSSTENTNIQSEAVLSKYKKMEANLKWRADPVILTLETPQFKSILRKNILDLVALFQKYDYEIRIAGGAVR